MGTDVSRFRMKLGTAEWDLLKIVEAAKGDTYFILPIPGEGLHISFHASGEVHLRGRKNPQTGEYEIDEPIDIDLSMFEDDSEGAAEGLLNDILVEPPADEDYLTLPASKIGFLGCISDFPNEDMMLDWLPLLSDILSSSDIFSFSDLARYPGTIEDGSPLLAMGLESHSMIIPLPADSFERSTAISVDRLIGHEGQSSFSKGFVSPLMGALEKGLSMVRPESINEWAPKVDSGEIMTEFNRLLDNPAIRLNMERLSERMR